LSSWLRRSSDRSAQRMMADERQHPILVAVIRRHFHNIEFARLACNVVGGASYRCAENAGPLCKEGVVVEVCRIMQLHMHDSVAMDLGCEALWRLAERGGGFFIWEAGAVPIILDALHMHRDNPFLQSNACNALAPLVARASPELLERMKAEATSAVSTHVGHKPIARAAERLIAACMEASLVVAGTVAVEVEKSCKVAHVEVDDVCNVLQEDSAQVHISRPRSSCTEIGSVDHQGHNSRIKDWLHEVDGEGFLMRYLAQLEQRFSSPSEVIDAYMLDGRLVNVALFEEFGVKRLGHRRLFQTWFRDHSSRWLPRTE